MQELKLEFENKEVKATSVTCLGMTFESDEARRAYFREELRRKLPELKQIEGFPIGEDEDIIRLSDPPYYTACPNPWLNDFIAEWEKEKIELEKQGKRQENFKVEEPYTEGIKEGKNSAIYNAHTYHTKVPYQIIMRYILHYTQPGDIVLDGFAGTGMAGVAASACGKPDPITKRNIEADFLKGSLNKPNWGYRHAICGDLSPLCFHISSNYNRTANAKQITKAVDKIVQILNERFGYLYEIETSFGKGHINYFVWSEVVACVNCGYELNVHDLSYDYEKEKLYNKLKCPNCGTEQKRKDANQIIETNFDHILHQPTETVKYNQSIFNYSINKKGRFFSTEEKIFNNINFEGYIPTDAVPTEGDEIPRLYRVGCNTINNIYPERTQYVLAFLYKLINDDYKEFQKELMFIFTSMLPKLTKMNRYMPQHKSRALVGPMANTLYIPPQYVENNPIDQFIYQAKKVIKAFEFFGSGNAVQICSATQQSIFDNSVDYIFTDPPFGANIMYSELNTISEAWLKVKTNNKEEAISNRTQRKGIVEYQDIMTDCFKEYYRILKPGHWMTVEFSNTSAAFWNSLQNSIQSAGFVITTVTDLYKGRGGLHAMLGPTAVKQDLAITCYKPSAELLQKFETTQDKSENVWSFIEELLLCLPVHLVKDNSTTTLVERNPKILYDRLISYYVQHGYNVPLSASEFQKGLRERFVERDGMFFTPEQVVEYEEKKSKMPDMVPMPLFIGSEIEGIEWLKRELETTPKTYQELQPRWMQDLVAPKKGDELPEMSQILEENFLKDEEGRWYKPDLENEADLEKVRTRKLLKEFNMYVEMASKPNTKIRTVRLEALRVGFKEAYSNKDFATIVQVGNRLPESLLMEDEALLQYYDIASSRV